jgi:glycosyltransferase involved in cell wall biosynthesis
MSYSLNNQPRIVHATSVHSRYDVRIFVKECRSLAKFYNEVYLVVADGLGDEIKDSVNIIDVGKPADTSRIKRILFTAPKVINKAHSLKPNIVHIHDPELLPITSWFFGNKVKVIYDAHEDVPRQVLAKYWIPKLFRKPLSWIVEKIENYCASRATCIFAPTPLIRDRFATICREVLVVCNYPTIEEFNSTPPPWESRVDEVCYVGDLNSGRGIELIVKAMDGLDIKLNLAGKWAGDGLRNRLIGLKVWSQVNELGYLSRDKVVELLARCKVGIVTLLPKPNDVESFPVKLFEYMAAGLPIVASDFPVWREIICKTNDSCCGLLVDPCNSQAIAGAIKYLIENNSVAEKMGAVGRQAVLKKYNWAMEEAKVIEYYTKLL